MDLGDPCITMVTGGGGQSIRKSETVVNGANTAVNVGRGQYGADDLLGLWIAAEQEHSDSKDT
jgi:hypothetical protein